MSGETSTASGEEKQKLISEDVWAQKQAHKAESEEVRAHPRRDCILTSFWIFLVGLTLLFFLLGFSMERPLLGPLFIAAVIPSLFILYIAYRRELKGAERKARGACATCAAGHEDKVPLEVLIVGFSLGILVTIPVGLIGGLIQVGSENALKHSHMSFPVLFFYVAVEAFIFTACLEEGAKYLCAIVSVDKDSLAEYVKHPYGVVLFSLAGALGFAALENVTYVLGEKSDEASWFLALIRALLAVPLHGTTGAIIGIGLARRYFFADSSQSIIKVLALPVFIHGFYDFVWMAPLRNGPFQPANKGHNLMTENNTADIGAFLVLLYAINLLVVIFGARYAVIKGCALRDEYHKQKEAVAAAEASKV